MADGNQTDTVSRQYNSSENAGFQENPSNGNRYTAVKLLCVPCRVPLVIGHSNQAHSVCRHCTYFDSSGVSGKSLERKPRYFSEIVVYCKVSSRLYSPITTKPTPYVDNAFTFWVSGNSPECKSRYSREVPIFQRKLPFLIGRLQTN